MLTSERIQEAIEPDPPNVQMFFKRYSGVKKFAQVKFDGHRCNILKRGTKIQVGNRHKSIWSSTDFIGNPRAWNQLQQLPDGWYDAELYRRPMNGQQSNVYVVNSLKLRDDPNYALSFAIFDNRDLTGVHSERMQWLRDNLPDLRDVHLVPEYPISTPKEAENIYNEVTKDQIFEGVVLKPDIVYSNARWMKLKDYKALTVVILGVKKTAQFAQGVAQSLLVGVKHGSEYERLTTVSSWEGPEGSTWKREIAKLCHPDMNGFRTGEDKDFVYLNPERLMPLDIKYLQLLEKEGRLSLREPRVVKVRTDIKKSQIDALCGFNQLSKIRRVVLDPIATMDRSFFNDELLRI